MSPLEYIGDSLAWWPQYVLLTVVFLGVHALLIRRWAFGIFDPMFMLLIASAFSWAIVWFMYWRGDIATVYVVSFTLTELAFYAGIEMGRPGHQRLLAAGFIADRAEGALPALTLVAAATVHLGSNLAIWAIAGIPIFRESRLGAFQDSGGLGILERLGDASTLIAGFAAMYLLIFHRRTRRRPLIWVFLLWYVAATAMSGSKGAFLTLVQYVLSVCFVYASLRQRRDGFWGGSAGKWLIGLATLFAIGVLAIQNSSDLALATIGLAYRIVSNGDVFISAYPYATIESLRGSNPLIGMFGGFLSTFRLFPRDLLYPPLGFQFTGILFPDLDLLVGPNAQHPIFGYHFFGMAAPVFSFVLGRITVAVQRGFYASTHSTFLGGLVSFMLLFSLVGIGTDFDYSLSRLASMIIGLIVIVGPVLLLCPQVAIVRHPRAARPTARPAG